jgi:hypothetical protein
LTAGCGQGVFAGFEGQVAAHYIWGGKVARFDAGALDNPIV